MESNWRRWTGNGRVDTCRTFQKPKNYFFEFACERRIGGPNNCPKDLNQKHM